MSPTSGTFSNDRTHASFPEHNSSIWAIAATATDHVLSASADGTVALHASSTSTIPEIEGRPSIQHAQASPGARIWTLPRQPLGFVGLSVAVSDPASEPAPEIARRALCNSMSGKTTLIDFGSGEILGTKESLEKDPSTGAMPTEPAWSTSLSSDGVTYASTSGSSGNVYIHDAAPGPTFGTTLSTLSIGRNKWGMHLRHNPDGSKVAMSTESGTIYVFDTRKEALVSTFASHAMCVRTLSWSADGKLLLSGSDDKRLVLHDVRSSSKGGGSAVAHLAGHRDWVLSVAISPDGRLAISGSSDKTIRVWDLAARASVSIIAEPAEVWSVAWRSRVPGTVVGAGGGAGFVSGGEQGIVRWYRSAGVA